jgi:lysophospholipase L1-like esterase
VVLTGISAAVLALTTVGSADGDPCAVPAAADHAAVGEGPSVTFVGDSWTVGQGATAHRGYAVLTGEQLGWSYRTIGVGGSGYTRPGAAGCTFGQRIDRAADTAADLIVVQGSLNERRGSPEALAPAALATLTRLRETADPQTQILVVGSTYAPGTPDATIDWINEEIAAAAEQVGLPFVDPAAEGWIDARDPALWTDPSHPNDAGYQVVADHLQDVLRGMVDH